jgi:hypothetical protein
MTYLTAELGARIVTHHPGANTFWEVVLEINGLCFEEEIVSRTGVHKFTECG